MIEQLHFLLAILGFVMFHLLFFALGACIGHLIMKLYEFTTKRGEYK